MELGLYERLALAGRIVASADVRGIGETKPPHMGVNFGLPAYRFLFDAENGVNLMAWYMDETLFGMRVFDVLRTVDYVLEPLTSISKSGLRLIGQGAGALWAMHAAASRSANYLSRGGTRPRSPGAALRKPTAICTTPESSSATC